MFLKWFEDMSFIYVGAGLPMEFGVLGIGISYFSSSDFEEVLSDGSISDTKINTSDYTIIASFSKKFFKILNTGISLKYITSTLSDKPVNSYAVDIGAQCKMQILPLILGFAIQNLGTPQKFVKDTTPLPLNIKLGIGYEMIYKNTHNVIWDLDFNIANDSDFIARLFQFDLGCNLLVERTALLQQGLGVNCRYQNM